MSSGMAPCADGSRVRLLVDLIGRFGEARLRVTGVSMLPSILPGDVLTIRRRSMDDVCRGEVAVFARGDRLFVHRVIHRHDTHLITQGDSVPSPDPPVSRDEFLGTVVLLVRR